MENITKEFWYGNIIPQNDCRPMSEECKELSELIVCNKNKLISGLNDEQREVFDKLDSCLAEYISFNEEAIFAYAFRLGLRIATEAFEDKLH